MYELTQVAGNSYYIQSPAKIGLVRLNDTDVCLIDSGNDKEAGRKVRQILDANGWHLTAIYNTHSNADHIGGNQYLQNQTGCKVYAPGIECDFTRHPVLEPSFLYGGYPPKELQHKFLMAKPSDAQELTPACLPEGFEWLSLPGHFFDMVGFRTPDDVVYLADCLSSRETLEKQLGREPTMDEIAQSAGLTRREVTAALESVVEPISLDEPVYTDGGDAMYVIDQVRDPDGEDSWISGLQFRQTVAGLTPREKRIMELRYLQGKTQMEVAQEIGISQAQVSRLEKGALSQFRTRD